MDWISELISEYLAGLTLSSASRANLDELAERGRSELDRQPSRRAEAQANLEELLRSISGSAVTAVTEPPAEEGSEERAIPDKQFTALIMSFCPKWPWC